MKKQILLFALFLPLFFYSQLSLNNIKKLYTMDLESLESYCVDGLGLKKIAENIEGNSTKLEFISQGSTLKDLFYISILNSKLSNENILTLRNGNLEKIQKLKSELIEDGFGYNGELKMELIIFHHYLLGKTNVIITKDVNSKGVYEINVFPAD